MSPSGPYARGEEQQKLRRSARLYSLRDAPSNLERRANRLAGFSTATTRSTRQPARARSVKAGGERDGEKVDEASSSSRASQRVDTASQSLSRSKGEKGQHSHHVISLNCASALRKRRAALQLKKALVNNSNGSALSHDAGRRQARQRAQRAKKRSSLQSRATSAVKVTQLKRKPASHRQATPPIVEPVSSPLSTPSRAPAAKLRVESAPRNDMVRDESPSPSNRDVRARYKAMPPSSRPRRPLQPRMRGLPSSPVVDLPLSPIIEEEDAQPPSPIVEEEDEATPSSPTRDQQQHSSPRATARLTSIEGETGSQRLPRASEVFGRRRDGTIGAIMALDLAADLWERGEKAAAIVALDRACTKIACSNDYALCQFVGKLAIRLERFSAAHYALEQAYNLAPDDEKVEALSAYVDVYRRHIAQLEAGARSLALPSARQQEGSTLNYDVKHIVNLFDILDGTYAELLELLSDSPTQMARVEAQRLRAAQDRREWTKHLEWEERPMEEVDQPMITAA